MTTREEIIALAKECGFGNADVCEGVFYPNFERFFHAAQKQAYERAAERCTAEASAWVYPSHGNASAMMCATAIRALIEGETNG